MAGIDRLGVLQFVVVHDLRLGFAGNPLFAVAFARNIVLGEAARVAACADFPPAKRIDHVSLRESNARISAGFRFHSRMVDCACMATKKSAQLTKVSRLRATKLPPRDATQVARIAAQLKPARAGFTRRQNVLLFSGARAALAAQVLAQALGGDLYRIDLSAVVSKFIGDTEKNLRGIFDAAEESGSVLFLDEADALFDKRTDVKDSHDRFSNATVNYLLHRLEAFAGVAILAVSRRTNIDPAFLRRLRIHEFPPTR